MRSKDILIEGVNAYLQMFNGFPPQSMKAIKAAVRDVDAGLKRSDRVVWYLRYYRIAEVSALIAKGVEFPERQLNKLAASVSKTATFEEAAQRAVGVVSSFQTFKHYVDLKLPDIDKMVWNEQTPEVLLQDMHVVEKKWQENLKNSVEHYGDEDMVLDCGDGWAWFDLNTHYCRKEADAMGHCGNAGGNHNQTILSLRKLVTDNKWTPRATFILDRHTGIIGEMKGRFNEKPEEKYHPQIMALLRHDIIKGIKGGGYRPENNFSMDDLDRDEAEALKTEKPGLRMAHELYTEWEEGKKKGDLSPELDEAFKQKVEAELAEYRYDSIDWDSEEIIISKTKDEHFFTDHMEMHSVDNLLGDDGDELSQLIQQYAPRISDEDSIHLGRVVAGAYFDHVMKYFINHMSYELYEVYAEWDIKEHTVTEMITLRDFLYIDEEQLGYVRELDDQRDEDPDYSEHPIEGDEIDDAIFKYVTSRKETGRDLVNAILHQYMDENGKLRTQAGAGGTTDDPNQLSFDFDR